MNVEYPKEGINEPQLSQQEINQDPSSFMPLPFSEPRPDFIPTEVIERQAERIKEEINPHLLTGVSKFIEKHDLGDKFGLNTQVQQQSWLWAVKSSKYNAVYFISRR